MPELPDILAYVEGLGRRVTDAPLEQVLVRSPFVLRSFDPPIEAAEGRVVQRVGRLGKRVVLSLTDDLHLVFHLMIAGRFQWKQPGAKPPGKITLATFRFPTGTLVLTEASQKKRAALHVVSGQAALVAHEPGGIDVLEADLTAFANALRTGNNTLKRALTDPRRFSGIGNAYSDEILHAAGLSPVMLTGRLSNDQVARLHDATRQVLMHWIEKLSARFAKRFPGPGEVTAFQDGFAVHGRYGKECPICGTTVQRIRYAENETNYCPRCQTDGRVLADRSLSRLLKDDWPRTIEELEEGL